MYKREKRVEYKIRCESVGGGKGGCRGGGGGGLGGGLVAIRLITWIFQCFHYYPSEQGQVLENQCIFAIH